MKKAKIKGITKLGSKKTKYQLNNPNAKILETFENKYQTQMQLITFSMPRDEFSSLCPITGQPDQAKIEIIYIPREKMLESKSLKLYLFSFRNHGAFHEEIIHQITNDLYAKLQPDYLRVFGDFSPRGGISIKPIIEKYSYSFNSPFGNRVKNLVESWDRKKYIVY